MNKFNLQADIQPTRTSSEPGGNRLAEVEVLRAIAVMMVLLEHLTYNLLFWPTKLAFFIYRDTGLWSGVDLFFAISGFVIARSLLPRLVGVTDWVGFTRVAVPFWIARAWRLLPSAWLWLAMPLLLCVVFNKSGIYQTFSANWGMFIAGLLDVANFHVALNIKGKVGVAFVQWSLSLEEQFYLLLPFAAFFCGKRLVYPLLLLAAAGFFVSNSPIIFLVRLWPVAFGVLLALWTRHKTYQDCAPTGLAKSRFARIAVLVFLVGNLSSIGALSLNIVSFFQGPVALLSAMLVWIASYDRGYLWQPGSSRRMMELIAARSYSLYLVHIPVYLAAHEIWFRLYGVPSPNWRQGLLLVALTFLAVAIVAELNHRLLEKPLREYGKQLAARYRARTMAAAA